VNNGATADASSLSARELHQHLMRRTRRLRGVYRSLVVLSIIVFIGLLAHVIYYYNYLTDMRYDVLTAEGKVAAAIQYRRNLMPVLAESVASFVEHEDNVFNRTVDARERQLTPNVELQAKLKQAFERAGKGKGKRKAEAAPPAGIQDLFKRVMAIAEQYPQLKTSETFQLLMKQVADAETKIMVERSKYNDAVNVYTTALSMFPGNVYGHIFGFPLYDYFQVRPEAEWPKVRVTRASKDG
jgi:LemA protein